MTKEKTLRDLTFADDDLEWACALIDADDTPVTWDLKQDVPVPATAEPWPCREMSVH